MDLFGLDDMVFKQVMDTWNKSEHICLHGTGRKQRGRPVECSWADEQLPKRGKRLGNQLAGR